MSPREGWYSDPTGRFERRYWDGHTWTKHVRAGGVPATDEVESARPSNTPPSTASAVHDNRTRESRTIMSKVANALVEDAVFQLSKFDSVLKAAGAAPGSVGGVLAAFKNYYGGLWVGGRVTLTDSNVVFAPNAVNRAVHTGPLDISIPLTEISHVESLPGFVTKIVEIRTAGGVLKVRCWGAPALATAIEQARTAG